MKKSGVSPPPSTTKMDTHVFRLGEFSVENIEEAKFYNSPFEKLSIPEEKRKRESR
jgi:hypothetical protein